MEEKLREKNNNGGKILLSAPDLFISRRQEDDEHQERSFSGVGVLDPRDSGDHLPLFLHALVLLPLRLVPSINLSRESGVKKVVSDGDLFVVRLDEDSGEIMSVRLLEKSMAVRNESHVSLAVLASSAVSPVSVNQTLIAHHNATQSHNATDKPELRKGQETKGKGKKKKKGGRKEKMEKDVNKSKSLKKAKKPLAG